MTKKLLMLAIMVMVGSVMLFADTYVVTVNGERVEGKSVKKVLFDKEVVTVVLDDESTVTGFETATIVKGDVTGVRDMKFYNSTIAVNGNTLRIAGLMAGVPVEGYNTAGQLVAKAAAARRGDTIIDITALAGGIYVAKAGNNIVKFIKK